MGKLRSYLSQVQDFIVNPESRNIVLNDLDAEVRERNLNDKKERPTEAVVLRVFPKNQTAGDIKNGNKQYYSAVLRIEGEHDAISEPASFEDSNTAERAIDAHGTYYSRDTLSSATGKGDPPPPPKVGDIVPIEYIRGSYRFLVPTDNKPSSGVVGGSGGISAFKARTPKELAGKTGLDTSSASLTAASNNPLLTQSNVTNGKLPEGALETIPGITDLSKRPVKILKEVADEFKGLLKAFEAHFGYPLPLTDSYRSLERQEQTRKDKPTKSATPGTSPHGWGLAFDYNTSKKSFASPRYEWLFVNAPRFGFWNPAWAQRGGSMEEAWHFEVIDRKKYLKIFAAKEADEAE